MKIHRTISSSPTPCMIPLINVILLLLIFFLVTSSINQNPIRPITLPEIKTNSGTNPSTITLHITKEGNYFLNTDSIKQHELLPLIQTRILQNPNLRLHIRADKDLQASTLLSVSYQLQSLELPHITLLTTGENKG